MMRLHRRLRAPAFLIVLATSWYLQPTHASSLASGHGHAAKSTQPGGGQGPRQDGSSGGDNCVRTQGYWKTHSAHASNPSQHIPWPISEETPICSTTWFEAINTAPHGDPWFILAHQWIAAKLNVASGADPSVLGGDLDEAGNLLANNCNGLSGDDATRAIALASELDDYNNGRSGPPHCGDGGGITDCNGNGIDDSIDIADGTSQDANNDGIPDECETSVKEYCNGTGSQNGGVDCPCGNNVPNGPSGCANSSGNGASLTAAGNAFVSADTLVLTASNIPTGHVAYFLFAHGTGGGVPFGDGIRCIKGPFQRVQKISHSSGSDVFPAPNTPPISQQLGITAGQLTFFQVVYRDGAGPCHNGANATNALAIVWGP